MYNRENIQSGKFPSRSGLSSRTRPTNEEQVQINMEGDFDFDQEIDGLRSQVSRLKRVTYDIHNEAQEQNKFLDQMKEVMEQGQMALRRASKRLKKVYKQSKSNHIVWLIVFCIGVLFFVWLLAKLRHISKH